MRQAHAMVTTSLVVRGPSGRAIEGGRASKPLLNISARSSCTAVTASALTDMEWNFVGGMIASLVRLGSAARTPS
jgi:hypothetical protein